MKNLINISTENGYLIVSSREVAVNFEKQHKHIIEGIKAIETSVENSAHLFMESIYKDSYDRPQKEYLLTRDGFSLLVMGFTGQKALEWKLKYIEAFNKMEQELKNQSHLPISFEDMMILQLEEQKKLKNRVISIEDKLESLEVNPVQRKQLMNLRSKKVLELLGGKKSEAYKNSSFRGIVYADLSRQYNNYFDIPSYELTPKNRFNEALKLINAYNLSMDLALKLECINEQIAI